MSDGEIETTSAMQRDEVTAFDMQIEGTSCGWKGHRKQCRPVRPLKMVNALMEKTG